MIEDFHNLIKHTFNENGQFIAYISTKTPDEAEKLGKESNIECDTER